MPRRRSQPKPGILCADRCRHAPGEQSRRPCGSPCARSGNLAPPRTSVRGVRRHGRRRGRRVGQPNGGREYSAHLLEARTMLARRVRFARASRTPTARFITRGEANADFQGMGTTASPLVLVAARGAWWPTLATAASIDWRHPLGPIDVRSQPRVGNVGRRTCAQGSVAGFVPKNIITRSLGPHAEVKVDLEAPFRLSSAIVLSVQRWPNRPSAGRGTWRALAMHTARRNGARAGGFGEIPARRTR